MRLRAGIAVVVFSMALLLSGNCQAGAEEDPLKDDYGAEDFHDFTYREKKKTVIGVPPVPDPSGFLPLSLDHAPPGLRVYLDLSSMRIDPANSSLHFWLMLKSDQGGRNLSYEGYRCTANSYRVHAWGFPGESPDVRRNSAAQWRKALATPGARFRRELGDFYLCKNGMPLPSQDVLARIRHQTFDDDYDDGAF